MRDWTLPKILKIGLPVLIIVTTLILLFIFPGFLLDSYGVEPLANKRFSIWDDKDIIEKLKPADRLVETAFQKNFLMDFENEQIKEKFQGVVSSIEVKRNNQIELSNIYYLEDQLQWGKYLALAGEKKDFEKWLNMIEQLYLHEDAWVTKLNKQTDILEKTEITWAYDLEYAEILLTSYNRNPGKSLLKKIDTIMQRAWPFFSAKELAPNYSSKIERIFYPEPSSEAAPTANPELIDPYVDAEYSRLADINLYVLESFSLLDSKWEVIYSDWSKLIAGSVSEEQIFYPFGIWPDQKNYVATSGVALEAFTLDTVKIVFQLNQDQQNSNTEGFLARQILQTNNLFKSYNMASQQNMSEETDICALALFAEHTVSEITDPLDYQTSEIITAIRLGLSTRQLKDDFSPLNYLFYSQLADKKLHFSASDQLFVLTSGVIK
ncbi:MAG: hypothetical protein ACOX2H_00795 [Saccharofermentanales bacterium]|jgi:hypothetical protein|nr:hypothetical protein [Bacillota bacterium]